MSEWIDVRERTPSVEDGVVIVATENGRVLLGLFCLPSEMWSLPIDAEVTHWMPMPKHPNELEA